ncbi:hypothetical protein HELRODRAFT_168046 [Helobdella robusta]|uniref:Uncharacterized protein n=1 Tax=Helobdella robusta TaxID=6412 RepID=T1F039_HELRO|nr:hypothetical protein HELRODRAFT_168046 [Helobdella robusta]ESO10176.1 hypothetical protein HELRODRAFT_168046 [Helobdella robusta]
MNFENRWVLRSALNFASDGEVVRKKTIEANKETWTTVVRKSVDKELKVVQEKVKSVEEKVELNAEEGKRKERKRNNIVIHKLAENNASEAKEKNTADRKSVMFLFNEVLKKDIDDARYDKNRKRPMPRASEGVKN